MQILEDSLQPSLLTAHLLGVRSETRSIWHCYWQSPTLLLWRRQLRRLLGSVLQFSPDQVFRRYSKESADVLCDGHKVGWPVSMDPRWGPCCPPYSFRRRQKYHFSILLLRFTLVMRWRHRCTVQRPIISVTSYPRT